MRDDQRKASLILGFDTSGAHCAAALLSEGRVLASGCETMTRGQAERLMPLLEEVLAAAGVKWSDLNGLGVGVGPGNFTGIRLAVSAARGLALSLDIPAFGIDTFAAIVFDHKDPVLASVTAPRDQIYIKAPEETPKIVSADQAHVSNLPIATLEDPLRLATNIAHLAARGDGTTPPVPLYIRPADAAPSRLQPPRILANDT